MSAVDDNDASPSYESPAAPVGTYTPSPFIALDSPPPQRARVPRAAQPIDEVDDAYDASPPPKRPLPPLPQKATKPAVDDYNEPCRYNRVQQFLCSDNVPDSLKDVARTMLEKIATVLEVPKATQLTDPRLCEQVGQTIEKCQYIQQMRECMVRVAAVRQKVAQYSSGIREKIEPAMSAAEERTGGLYQEMVVAAKDPSVEPSDFLARLEECRQIVRDLESQIQGESAKTRKSYYGVENDAEQGEYESNTTSWWEDLLVALGLRK